MQEIETYLEEINGELTIKSDYLEKLKALKEQKDKVEKELKTLSSAITSEIKTRVNETTKVGDYNFVVKGGFYDFVFDMDTFMRENLEIYMRYLVPHESNKTYSLVSATREKKNV